MQKFKIKNRYIYMLRQTKRKIVEEDLQKLVSMKEDYKDKGTY